MKTITAFLFCCSTACGQWTTTTINLNDSWGQSRQSATTAFSNSVEDVRGGGPNFAKTVNLWSEPLIGTDVDYPAQILGATLNFKVVPPRIPTAGLPTGGAGTLKLYEAIVDVSKDGSTQVTWQSGGSFDPGFELAANPIEQGIDGGAHSIDVTDEVRGWAQSSTETNWGFVLRPLSFTGNTIRGVSLSGTDAPTLVAVWAIVGDSDGDGDFDPDDLVHAFSFGKYDTGAFATYEQGDWDQDGDFDPDDLIFALAFGHYDG